MFLTKQLTNIYTFLPQNNEKTFLEIWNIWNILTNFKIWNTQHSCIFFISILSNEMNWNTHSRHSPPLLDFSSVQHRKKKRLDKWLTKIETTWKQQITKIVIYRVCKQIYYYLFVFFPFFLDSWPGPEIQYFILM